LHEKRNVTPDILEVLRKGYPRISTRSFWISDKERRHDLCLGISWLSNEHHSLESKYEDCEVVVVDVKERRALQRIPGAFIGPAAGETQVAIWRDGQVRFIPLGAGP